ncbi:hypothetical protein POSPLADRAFT_1062825 [Postia placenta MAD-698-R-SB12]|uniref:Fungal-type protein kinase domain-containing protein n=1 Tax=Postia placenta MAD-698-R-SB12 TaxID=670580 RepID=A0A1X6MIR6_9APHY|nr:hypothetical protein POSPLADRAFT_1062825 [Postia placenta MAD-698-R-SB12]OSX56337.1 hypothetical protein POSPLADRAFT_1062825 [Postia placenta MAD-698-R-SB12]
MSHNIRCYGTGIMIEDFMVKLWYADRHGVVVSRPFDMFVESDKLLLVVAAIAGADIAKMGVCPFSRFPSSKLDSYEGSKLVFQPGPMTERLPEVEFTIDTSRPVETNFGIVGRGTTIIPLKATAEFWSEDLVAKMAWPRESRLAEADYIRVVRSRLARKPQYLHHIVDMKCWISRTMEEMKLPRASMALHNFEYERREFRMIVMKKYERLEQVESVDEFKRVFCDVVRAHYGVWETSSILHRDTSSYNVMFYRDDGRVVGVLCDWDMAACISPEDEAVNDDVDDDVPDSAAMKTQGTATMDGKPRAKAEYTTEAGVVNLRTEGRCKARQRTGTGPFMALDLLRAGPVPFPRYRYDLESFFFLLAWFCVVHDPVRHKFGHLPEWENSDMFTIGLYKREFLYHNGLFDQISRVGPTYLPLWESWVEPLRFLLGLYILDQDGINFLKRRLRAQRKKHSAAMTTATLEEIVVAKKRMHDPPTYEKFMEVLGEPLDITSS